VCGVLRAHILQSELEENAAAAAAATDEYRIFNDLESQQRSLKKKFRPNVDFVVKPPPPSLEDISTFYRDVFTRAQMETDCIIMSLIYVERLVKVTDGKLRPHQSNWRSILFSCMVLSSKVWDDMSMVRRVLHVWLLSRYECFGTIRWSSRGFNALLSLAVERRL
jgi:hypothetical protein